jgi:serine/threonine-protein kinase
VLYELVTGKKPYVAETTIEMFQKHVFPEHTPVRPARLVPDLPVWMDNLIMFLLEKDKDRRPLDAATVSKMISDIELKVQAQQSAGADRAKARKIDRTADTGEMTDEDKEAARALRGKKKKKKKSDAAPWYTKTWVKAVPLVLAIGLLGTGILFAVKSAGGRGSPPAGVSADEAAGKDWEKALHKRISSGMFKKGEGWEDKETYEVTWKAMERERDGNLKQAADLWADARRRLEDLSGEKIPAWRWVAEKRLKDIEAVDRKYAELQAKWKQQQIDELPWKFNAADPMSLATLALRY